MASSSSLDRFKRTTSGDDASLETIEMDPQYASGLGLQSGDIVSLQGTSHQRMSETDMLSRQVDIGLLHDLPVADSVTAESVSEDDWEVIVRRILHMYIHTRFTPAARNRTQHTLSKICFRKSALQTLDKK